MGSGVGGRAGRQAGGRVGRYTGRQGGRPHSLTTETNQPTNQLNQPPRESLARSQLRSTTQPAWMLSDCPLPPPHSLPGC